MRLVAEIRERVRSLLLAAREEREMAEEIRHHLALETEKHRRAGMSEADARRRARQRFGGVERIKEEVRDARGIRLVDDLIADVRYATRTLRRAPGFTLTATLSLALAIGANTTVFSLTDSILFQPLPGRDAGRLVTIYTSDFSGPRFGASSYPDYLDFKTRNEVFTDMAASRQTLVIVGSGEQSWRATVQMVTGNYFDLLGLQASYGRTFLPEEDRAGSAKAVVVLGHALWQQHFGGDPAVVGRTVRLNSVPFTVIGVAPEGFGGHIRGMAADLWIPLGIEPRMQPGSTRLQSRTNRGLKVVARLKPGVSIETAQANMTVIAKGLYLADPQSWRDRRDEARRVSVLPERESRVIPAVRGSVIGFMALLSGVVGLVLLIACANLANMLLARASARRREIAVRLAIGARRERIVRQLLTESVLLAVLAGSGGALLAYWALQGIGLLLQASPVTGLDVAMDGRVLAFNFVLSLVTTLLFGLAPAIQAARPAIAPDLHVSGGGHRPSLARRWILGNGLVVGQVAMSLLLLVAAGLILRSLTNASRLDPGFTAEHVLLFTVDPSLSGVEEPAGRRFYAELRQRLERLPQITSTSLATTLPLGRRFSRRSTTIEDYEAAEGEDREVHYASVDAGFMATMQTRVVRGRALTPRDTADALPVMLVNEAFVRRYWPGLDPLGKHVTLTRNGEAVDVTVVGVVADGKYLTLGEDPRPFMWLPHRQEYRSRMTVLARTIGDPLDLVPTVRQEVRALDPDLTIFDVTTLEAHARVALMPVQAAAAVLGLFGIVALVLAAGGIYGVTAFMLSQRTKEIGVRLAIGGTPPAVLRLVMRRGLALALVGGALGLAAAAGLTRFLTFLLYGLDPFDPLTLVVAAGAMAVVAVVACYIPARRAVGHDPLAALRDD